VPDPDFSDPCFLVVHPKGMLLFDTGLTDAQVGRPIYENKLGYEGQLKTVSLKGELANIGVTAPMITISPFPIPIGTMSAMPTTMPDRSGWRAGGI